MNTFINASAYNCPYNFAQLTVEEKDIARTAEYDKYLLSFVINQIRYENIDKYDVPPFYPELVAAYLGQYGVFPDKETGAPVIVPGAFSGTLDRYGRGKEYYGYTLDGQTWRGTVGIDCFVVPNNPLYMPDAFIVSRYAYMLSQADISLYYNITYSRMSNFYRADSDTEKAALEKAFSEMSAGKPLIYVTTPKKALNDVFDDAPKPLDTIELTNVKDSDKIQYISRVHDDIIGRFLTMYGIDVGNVNKGSQILRGELSRLEEAAAVTVYERLLCRQNVWNDINKAFGYDIKPVKSALYGDTPEAGTQQSDIVEPEGADASDQSTTDQSTDNQSTEGDDDDVKQTD